VVLPRAKHRGMGRDRWFRPVGSCCSFDERSSREVAGDDLGGMVIDAEQGTTVDLGWLLSGVLKWTC